MGLTVRRIRPESPPTSLGHDEGQSRATATAGPDLRKNVACLLGFIDSLGPLASDS